MSALQLPSREIAVPPDVTSRARRVVARLLLALMPVLLAYAVLLLLATLTTSFQNRALDFTPYYAAAAALRDNPAANIYDRAVLLRAAAEHPGCLLWPGAAYLYPPLLAILLVPLTYLPYDTAFHLWMLFNLALWAVCAGLLAHWLLLLWQGDLAPTAATQQHDSPRPSVQGSAKPLPQTRRPEILARATLLLRGEPDDHTLAVLLAVAAALLSWPILEGLLMGQVHLLILFLLLLAPLLLRRGHPLAAGSLLSLALMIKLLPIVLIVYYASRGRWRLVLGAALGTALLLSFTVLVTGLPPLLNAAATLSEVSARQSWYGNQALTQVPALLAAAFGWGDGPILRLASLLILALVALASAWILLATRRTNSRADGAAELLGYGWAICAMLLLAPLVWIHYNAWLLIPTIFCLGYALNARRQRTRRLPAWTFPLLAVLYALIFLPWSAAIDTLPPGAGPHLFGLGLVPLALLLHPLSALSLFTLAAWLYVRSLRERTSSL